METSGSVCVFNNRWQSLWAQRVILCHGWHQKWAEHFPAALRIVWASPPADMFFPWIRLKCDWLIIAAHRPECFRHLVLCAFVTPAFLKAPAEQSSLRDNSLFLLFNLCSLLFSARNTAQGHTVYFKLLLSEEKHCLAQLLCVLMPKLWVNKPLWT